MGKGLIVSSSSTTSPVAPTAPDDVTGLSAVVSYTPPDQQGKRYVTLTGSYTAPSPLGTFKGVHVYVEIPDGSSGSGPMLLGGFTLGTDNLNPDFTPVDSGRFSYDGASGQFIATLLPQPAATEDWRVYAVSYSDQIENELKSAIDGSPSPNTVVSVAPAAPLGIHGEEYAPNATNFTIDLVEYRVTDGGVWQWRFNASWDNDSTNPRYSSLGGDDLVIINEDGVGSLVASPSSNDLTFFGTWWNLDDAPTTYRVQLVAWDTFGKRNSVALGVTPSIVFVVQRPAGGTAREYTTLVDLATCVIEYQVNGEGVEEYRLVTAWVKPTGDGTFGGVKLVLRWSTDTSKDVVIGNVGVVNSFRTAWYAIAPGGSGTFDIYFVSYDTAMRTNTIDASITPKVAGVTVSYQTAGSLKGNRIGASTLESSLAINSALLGVANGGVTTAKLTASEISVGGAGSKPIRFRVYDSSGNPIGWIGDDSAVSGYVGAWFKQVYIGGSGPSGAPFQVDSAGKLAINLTSSTAGTVPFSLTLNSAVASITNGTDAATGVPAGFKMLETTNNSYSIVVPQGFFAISSGGAAIAQLQAVGTAPYRGRMLLADSADSGRTVSGNVGGAGSPLLEVTLSGGAMRMSCVGGTPALIANGTQVVTAQQTGPGNTSDATDVATRFNNLLTALRAHGLIT